MNRRWLAYLAFGLAAYLLFLLGTAPAGFLAWGLARVSDQALIIGGTSGTAWHGRGRLLVRQTANSVQDLGNVEWRLQGLQLMLARLAMKIDLIGPESTMHGTIAISPRQVGLESARVAASARMLGELYVPARLFAPQGQLRLSSHRLMLDRQGLHGNAAVLWEQAGSKLSRVQPLGDYRLDLASDGGRVDLKLSTVRGPLDLAGKGVWDIGGGGTLNITGIAQATSRQQDLEPLLKLMGRDLGNGRSAFRVDVRVPLGLVDKKFTLF
jgi:general secretion pathway protein N